MKNAHLQRLLTIVDRALALDPGERIRYLNDVCGEDTALRGEVGQLLESVGKSESFWNDWKEWNKQQIANLFEKTDPDDEQSRIGEQVGPWQLKKLLGRGGMGAVWLAERADGAYKQLVALKLLHQGTMQSKPEISTIHRFEQERQILAQLDHPNIARLYDGGVTGDGLPWLAMEYIDGLPVTDWCSQQNCTLKQRLGLFEQICQAIRYAHKNLIVHRDLKPQNILVTKEGRIKILDFGIAKLLDNELSASQRIHTQTGFRAMSLNYAAPEQITGEPVTTATDVYALGLLLYELLTGKYPYHLEGKNLRQIEQIIRTEEPVRPGVVRQEAGTISDGQELRGDLDAITMKALRKEPDGRYENAGQILDDLHRYQKHQPVLARRGTARYRLGKWFRRHHWTAASGVTVAFSLVIGIGVALWQAQEANRAAGQTAIALAETELALSRAEALQEFLIDLFQASAPDRPRDQLPATEEILERGAMQALDEESAPPAERIEMLLTISRIYRERNRFDQARQLLGAAATLARREQLFEDLARALTQQAIIAERENDLDAAETLLLEAEEVIGDSSDHMWETYARARSQRGWIEYRKGHHDQARSLLELLYAEMLERDPVDDRVRILIMEDLASVYRVTGNLEAAVELNTRVAETRRRTEGSESMDYAVSLVNIGNLEFNLGRFNAAEASLREAIALMDRIVDPGHQPSRYRSVARSNLALVLLKGGRFEEAQEELEAALEERASVAGRTTDTFELYFYQRGAQFASMQRWEEAEQYLTRARDLYLQIEPPAADSGEMVLIDAILAKTLCQLGKINDGMDILAQLNTYLEDRMPENPNQRAQIYEARAVCHFRAGNLTSALYEIDRSLDVEGHPGRAPARAVREVLHARILAALGRSRQSEQALNQAEKLYLDLGLADHPHFVHIDAARQELGLTGE